MTILLSLAVSYAVLCLVVFLFQERMIWFPSGPTGLTPQDVGLPGRSVTIDTPDGEQLAAWYLTTEPDGETAASKRGGVVLHCHGNGGELSGRASVARALLDLGLDVLLFDYRGYGASTGKLSEEGTYVDGTSAFDWLVAQGRPAEQIVLFGESLGGAIAVETALRRKPGALVLESTFTSIADIGAQAYPFLPIRLLSRVGYDNLSKLPDVTVPVLVMHSPEDRTVPFEHGKELARALPPRPGTGLVRTAGDHNDGGFVGREAPTAELRRFLDRFRSRSR